MESIITSVQNAKIKQWSKLLTRRGREEQGLFLLEGVHLVQEALANGVRLTAVLYALDRGIPAELTVYAESADFVEASPEWIGVSDAVLAKCTETGTPQGIVAVAVKPEWEASRILAVPSALLVAVDGVQDPGNLGTIIRSADAAGATAVLLGCGTVDLYNPKTLRSTQGSLFHLPVLECDLTEWLPQARKAGIAVTGTSLSADRDCYEADWTGPVCFVLGNEGKGVSPEVECHVDTRIIIPMAGRSESLNVAMAATVLLFEAMRQRRILLK